MKLSDKDGNEYWFEPHRNDTRSGELILQKPKPKPKLKKIEPEKQEG